jgi:hypothetical protein
MKSNKEIVATATKSPFTLGKAKVVSAQAGVRTSTEVKPVLELSSQFNKFRLNKLGSELMNVVAGDKVKLLINTGAETIDGHYLIAVAKDVDTACAKLLAAGGAKGHSAQQFNYSGMYGRMWQAVVGASDKGAKLFVAEGNAVEAKSKAVYLTSKVEYEVVKVDDISEESPLEVDGMEYTEVYALINPERIAVEPKAEMAEEVTEDTQSEPETEGEVEA